MPRAVVALRLPLPPTENHLYATFKGRRIKSKAAREYEVLVGRAVLAAGLAGVKFGGPVELSIRLYLSRDRDVTGNKALQDSLATAFGFDDKVIVRLVVDKQIDRARPRAEVQLRELGLADLLALGVKPC